MAIAAHYKRQMRILPKPSAFAHESNVLQEFYLFPETFSGFERKCDSRPNEHTIFPRQDGAHGKAAHLYGNNSQRATEASMAEWLQTNIQ